MTKMASSSLQPRQATIGSSPLAHRFSVSAVSDEVKARTLRTGLSTATYDERAKANQIGEPMICVCFTCAGKLIYDDPIHYIRGPFRKLPPHEAIEKWGGEILRTTWCHAATDSMRGRNPTKPSQHLTVIL